MINLDSVLIRNFMSWGNYDTRVKLSDRDRCFIAGEIEDPESTLPKSNGAGKSSLLQAVLWCLSGRTMYRKAPGNGILNRFTEEDCNVSLFFKDGATLTRVRRREGVTELLYSNGDGRPVVEGTLSTTSNQQRQLEQELNFDFEIFCGSTFFNQFSHPWMEMGDQPRRKVMERIMGVDRLSVYAEVAKRKRDKVSQEQEKLNAKADGVQSAIKSLQEQKTSTIRLSEKFDTERAQKVQAKLNQAAQSDKLAEQFEEIDVAALEKRWTLVEKVKAKIQDMRDQSKGYSGQIGALDIERDALEEDIDNRIEALNQLTSTAIAQINAAVKEKTSKLERDSKATIQRISNQKSEVQGKILGLQRRIKDLDTAIKLWQDKGGQICTECEQEIPIAHTENKIKPKLEEKEQTEAKIEDLERECQALTEAIKTTEDEKETQVTEIEEEGEKKVATLELQRGEDLERLQQEFDEAGFDARIEGLKEQKAKLDAQIEEAEQKLTKATPDKTVNEATSENARKQQYLDAAERAKAEAKALEEEQNPHLASITSLDGKIGEKTNELEKIQHDVSRYDLIYQHFHYIYKTYSDRRRAKSYLIGRHRPYFNHRLGHYLDSFDLDVKIQLTDSLGLESSLWGYDFQSGGERARTNLAFLFAVFDLHTGIHGRQCNILVLDEPDHHLDEAGRAMLIDIINDDLACRFDTIFIISHNEAFRDIFPSQLTVRRVDRLSHLDETR